jgi:hypothetical protein
MSRFGFVGPSYQSQSLNADAQKCLNWYVEPDESGWGKSAMMLYPTGGLKTFCSIGLGPIRASEEINGRLFVVSNTGLFEVFQNGTFQQYGIVGSDGKICSMVASPIQLCVCSAGNLFVLDLRTNILSQVSSTMLVGTPSKVDYLDGFFVALFKDSQTIQVSNLFDATTWNTLNFLEVNAFPDNINSMLVDHRELWLWGQKQSIVMYDAGLPIFPFAVNPSAILEQGCGAEFSPTRLDNTVFWLGLDERGQAIIWRAQGYNPMRVSNFAVETAMQSYPTVSDAIGYGFQDQGHSFYQIYFPTANKTWVYDAATQFWHERDHFENGTVSAHRSQVHSFNFDQHLVGDWKTGNIYSMSINNLTNFGNPIQRVRRAPHISSEQQWIFHHQMQVDLETGVGPMPPLEDGRGNPRDPEAILRWSDDGGHTWSNEHSVGIGQAGNYRKRAIWRRLGRSRDRVYELKITDPVPARVIDAYLLATPGFQPQERLSRTIGKMA